MKLQLAIDRVPLEKAIQIIHHTKDFVDIFEIGTSLIKDYGMHAVRKIRENFPDITILADLKTIDEAEYEFEAVYQAGADIATVMGAAALNTIAICEEVSKKYKKDYVIDLLEVNDAKLEQLLRFETAIFAIHLAMDQTSLSLESLLETTIGKLKAKRTAIAGGISLQTIPLIKTNGIDIVIVGGAITKSKDPSASARKMKEAIGD